MADGLAELTEISDPPTVLGLPIADTFVQYSSGSNGNQGPLDIIAPDALNNRIVVLDKGQGTYSIALSAQIGATKKSLIGAAVFINNVFQPNLLCLREIATPNDIGSMSVTAPSKLNPGDIITLRFESDKMNTNILLFQVTLAVSSQVRDIVP